MTYHPSKGPPPKSITLEVRFRYMNLDTNIHTVANTDRLLLSFYEKISALSFVSNNVLGKSGSAFVIFRVSPTTSSVMLGK